LLILGTLAVLAAEAETAVIQQTRIAIAPKYQCLLMVTAPKSITNLHPVSPFVQPNAIASRSRIWACERLSSQRLIEIIARSAISARSRSKIVLKKLTASE
jgi:hypothetical protein